ncbi:MAG: ATP-dependent RecD-like DNA helicase [Thermodesulfobacteriota bacterium]|jgi:exodeoxyribonuclease V alpha subunit
MQTGTNSLSKIQGQIERITFANEENGFTIARLKTKGEKDLVTVVGSLPGINPGEVLELLGEWSNHPKFGQQFKVVKFKSVMPATAAGIEKYLGSGLIKGIGPIMASRLVNKFGVDTLEIIDTNPERLEEVEGIGEKRVQMIRNAWDAQKEIREVMVFLQGHGVSSTYSAKIYKQYGQGSIKVVQENPYRLAADIFGIGFKTADKIAGNLGIDRNSEIRAEAGILYVLHELADDGHVYYPYEPLIEACQKILEVDKEIIIKALAKLFEERKIVLEDLNDLKEEFTPNNKGVYLTGYHVAEQNIALKLKILLNSPSNLRQIDEDKALEWVQTRLDIQLTEKQKEGVKTAIKQKVMVLTGGPGTGKTTIIKAILEIYQRLTPKIVMGAPTGRAAKRMSEATGWEAKTLHRVLEWSPKEMGLKKDGDHPLDADVVIVDEASMIDNLLMHHFLKAVPRGSVLVLVGDVNQLPSVGAGNVLKDIIASGLVPVVELNEIFRQAMGSLIITNAHRINQGEFPRIPDPKEETLQDFYFIQKEKPEDVLATILDLVTNRIPSRFKINPIDGIQVLTPMHRGVIGAENLNKVLQEALNKSQVELPRGGRIYKLGDKVMQIKNDYDREVFNGDIGRITRIDPEEQEVTVEFDGRQVEYDFSDLNELLLAYAVSVHKSQGSEYPVVVIPVHISHYMLLQRNLLYTGVTRARKLVIIVGTKKALSIGIRNNKIQKRFTGLCQKLKA